MCICVCVCSLARILWDFFGGYGGHNNNIGGQRIKTPSETPKCRLFLTATVGGHLAVKAVILAVKWRSSLRRRPFYSPGNTGEAFVRYLFPPYPPRGRRELLRCVPRCFSCPVGELRGARLERILSGEIAISTVARAKRGGVYRITRPVFQRYTPEQEHTKL